jgi:hypothetical protein
MRPQTAGAGKHRGPRGISAARLPPEALVPRLGFAVPCRDGAAELPRSNLPSPSVAWEAFRAGFSCRAGRSSGPRRAPRGDVKRARFRGRRRQPQLLLLLFALLMHFERKLLRALPCKPFSSACFEHSSEAALRVVCAAAEPVVASSPMTRMARIGLRIAFYLWRHDRRAQQTTPSNTFGSPPANNVAKPWPHG